MAIPKRRKDHNWKIIKYSGDGQVYARCKCGYEYGIFHYSPTCKTKKNENGDLVLTVEPDILHLYCPYCGAKKKTWDNTVKLLPSRWE